jgi:hypothetical protein
MEIMEQLIAVYVGGKSYSFRRSSAEAGSIYGGPLRETVTGCSFGPSRLHHVASLGHLSLPLLGDPPRYVFSFPLVYGFRFDGCLLEYRFEPTKIELLRFHPIDRRMTGRILTIRPSFRTSRLRRNHRPRKTGQHLPRSSACFLTNSLQSWLQSCHQHFLSASPYGGGMAIWRGSAWYSSATSLASRYVPTMCVVRECGRSASGRQLPVVTVCDFSELATCYADPNG